MDYNTKKDKEMEVGKETAPKDAQASSKGVDSMIYQNYTDSPSSSYDKSSHIFSACPRCDWSPQQALRELFDIDLKTEGWNEAVQDPQGCEIVLPLGFVFYDIFSRFWAQLVETGRISKIEYIKNVAYSSHEEFQKMSNEEKARNCIDCVRIVLAAEPQSEIRMRLRGEDDFFPVPYDDVRGHNVLAPDRYPRIDEHKTNAEGNGEPLSKYASIVEYTGNAPDLLIMKGDYLLGIDDLPAVLNKNIRPKYALKIDLVFWYPEYLQGILSDYANEILYGTIPSPAGEADRLKKILTLNVPPPPSLQEQMESILELKLKQSLPTTKDAAADSPEGEENHDIPSDAHDHIDVSSDTEKQPPDYYQEICTGLLGGIATGFASVLTGPIAPVVAGVGLALGASARRKRVSDTERLLEQYRKELDEQLKAKEEHVRKQIKKNEALIEGLNIFYKRYLAEHASINAVCSKCVSVRSAVDLCAREIMQGGIEVDSKKMSDLSEQLQTAVDVNLEIKEILQESGFWQKEYNTRWLHGLDVDGISNLVRMTAAILRLKELLSRERLDPLEKVCPEYRDIMSSSLATEQGFFPNLGYALQNILESRSNEYVLKEKEAARKKAAKALLERREADRKEKKAKEESEEARIRAEERQAVLYEMSHHIKNLVVSVIDPLENMVGTVPDNSKHVLADAINGANMIRQIVFFITNSYRSTVEDFLYDLSNPENNPQTIESLFESTLRASVANMFDKQTHGKYMREFFRSKDFFAKAKKDWYDTRDLSGVIRFMNETMNIKTDIALDSFQSIRIGDAKGSATNLAILFNELIMNMLKALAYVPEKDRLFLVSLEKDDDMIVFHFANTSINAGTISHGYGKTIVTNIAKGLGGTLSSQTNGNQYSVEMNLPFFKKTITSQRD